ncbi:MAG: hypothetical protein KBF17_12355 [Candidatus Promineofilum sp.]|nr:hypothetical protein [Promineifilum sp.]
MGAQFDHAGDEVGQAGLSLHVEDQLAGLIPLGRPGQVLVIDAQLEAQVAQLAVAEQGADLLQQAGLVGRAAVGGVHCVLFNERRN